MEAGLTGEDRPEEETEWDLEPGEEEDKEEAGPDSSSNSSSPDHFIDNDNSIPDWKKK